MARFFFHVFDGLGAPDEDGAELPDVQAARIEAARLAGQLLIDRPDAFWSEKEWRVEVRDPAGLILFAVTFMATEALPMRQP